MFSEYDFSPYFYSPEVLASKILEVYFGGNKPSYPIDPFKILTDLNIIYQFRDFKELEGIYLVPDNNEDIAIVGININRPIARQRFTAAHELCHHIKDRYDQTFCPINSQRKGSKGKKEKYADRFASELLMPTTELKAVSEKYLKDGYIQIGDDILYLADYFGVSFESCVFALAYKLNRIPGNTDSRKLKKAVSKYKPDKKRQELRLKLFDTGLLHNIIDAYKYFFVNENKAVWYKFKTDFVYNENRLERVNIDYQDVADILADLRLKKQESEYCNINYKEVVEVVGHAAMYDYLMDTNDEITAYKMLNLNKMLYQYAPYPESAGKIRKSNNLVCSAVFETVDWQAIPNEIVKLDSQIKDLKARLEQLSFSEYIYEVIKIHHRITVIHPFSDGNGRVARVMLNWLFKIKGLPPVYLKYENKEDYYNALKKADLEDDFEELFQVFCREVLRTMIQLNSKYTL